MEEKKVLKHKKFMPMVIGLVLVAVLAVVGVVLYMNLGNKISISFSDEMPKTASVNQVLDITQYVNNPNNESLVLTAEYEQDGNTNQYMAAGLSFKPTYTGEVKLTVTIAGTKKHIDTTIEIIEEAPVYVSAEEANYYVGQTIKLQDLMEYVVYDSRSTPEFSVYKVEYGANKLELEGKEEFTFNEISEYIFYIELKNSGGTAEGIVNAHVTRELTAKEKDDLTNTIRLTNNTHASIQISDDEHSKNSDWAWEITANPADYYEDGKIDFFRNTVYIDFGKEIDTAKEYFTMDVKVTEDTNGFRFNLMDSAGQLHERALDFNDVKGEWFTVSSKELYDVGYYTGIFITVMHPRGEDLVGTYNAQNVKVYVDNCHLHDRGKVNPLTNKVVSGGSGSARLTTPVADVLQCASYLQMQGNYSEECFEVTTKITQKKENSPNLMFGARLDKVTSNITDSNGIIIAVFNNRLAYYAPNYTGTTHKGSFGYSGFTLESGKTYTFVVQVDTEKNGTEILNFIIKEGDKVLGMYSHTANIADKGAINVADKGSFAMWNLDEERTVSYKKPYKKPENVNKVVASNGKAGTANLVSAYPGTIENTSYLEMKGKYKAECFEITTKISEQREYQPSLMLGARLDKVTSNILDSNGIIIAVFYNRIAYYAPNYIGTTHKGSFGYSGFKLEKGKEYTFIVQVDTEKNGTEILNIIIKDGDKVLGTYSHTTNIASKGKVDVANSGSFAVWNMDKKLTVSYKKPYKKPENVNKVVASNGKAGTANLVSVYPGMIEDASYLEMKGNYKEECFEITTKISEQREYQPSLMLGARLDKVTSNILGSNGIIIAVFYNRIAYYAPNYTGTTHKGSFGYSGFKLEIGKEYTFIVQVDTEKNGTEILNIIIKDGDKVLGTYSHTTNIASKGKVDVANSGSFAVWNMDKKLTISYKMPYKKTENVNKVVASNAQAGMTTLISAYPGVIEDASFLEMKGNYKEECFEITTKITEQSETEPNFLLGARLDKVTSNILDSNGIVISVFYNRLAYYAPNYTGTTHKGSFGYSGFKLEKGKEYTFVVQVDTESDGTEILNIIIKDGETVLGTYSHTANIASKGTINVANSGSFAVWNLDKERTVSYKMPYNKTVNVNKIVTATDGDGSATLTTAYPGVREAASYLEMKGNYKEESFAFTTKITEQKENEPNLMLGARLDKVTSNILDSNGILVMVFHNRMAYYAPNYAGASHKGSFGFSGFTLEYGKDYTFVIQVNTESDGTEILNFTIKDGNTVLGTYSHTSNLAAKGAIDVVDSGSFAVWNLDATRTIDYKQPREAYDSYTVSVIVNGNDTTYSDAKTGLSFKLNDMPDVPENKEFAHTADNQVLYNGIEVSDYRFSRVGDTFALGIGASVETPAEGDVITVSGVFETVADGVKGFELDAYAFTYVGGAWTWRTHEVNTITNGNINITGGLQDEFLFNFTVNPNTPRELHLQSDGNHKVIYNGTELAKAQYGFYKVNEDGRYVLGVANAVAKPVKGSKLTIKGVFEATKDSVPYGLVVKEHTFYYNGEKWTNEYVEADPVEPENSNVKVTVTQIHVASNTDSYGFEAKSSSECYLWLDVDKAKLYEDLGYTSGQYSDYFKAIVNGAELNCRLRVFNNCFALVLPATSFNSLKNVRGTNITIPKGTTVSSSVADTKILEFRETFTYCNQDGTVWRMVESIPIQFTGVRQLSTADKFLRFNLNITSLPTDVNIFFHEVPVYINGVEQVLVVRTIKHGSIFHVILDENNLPEMKEGLTVSVPEGTVFVPSSSDGYKINYPQSYILEQGIKARYNGSSWVNE